MRSFRVTTLLAGCSAIVAAAPPACSNGQPTTVAPLQNVWPPLTSLEISSVVDLLNSTFNLSSNSAFGGPAPGVNTLSGIDTLPPNKTDVLPYLAGGPLPPRYAFATVAFGNTTEPYFQDYTIGPLPVCATTKVEARTFSTRSTGKVYFRNQNRESSSLVSDKILADSKSTLTKFFNISDAVYANITMGGWKQPELLENSTVYWFEFYDGVTGPSDSGTLLSTGLYCRVAFTADGSSVTGWFYNNVVYTSLAQLSKASEEPGFVKLPRNIDGTWSSTDRHGTSAPMDSHPPPEPVDGANKRFSLDKSENYVEWMDFSFYVTKSRDMGIKMFDLKYKGKRIIYELGMEEALAHYASNNPVHSRTLYFDTYYAFGDSISPLVPGYDCPTYSTYLDFNVSGAFSSSPADQQLLKNAVCLFEMDAGYPIRRHTSFTATSISKNILFTLRTVSTIGNYDYLTSYEFAMDGSITVSVRASGYIEAAYFANNEDYSFKIHEALSGSMHDHVITFKADFDILGTKNSLQKIEMMPVTKYYEWEDGRPANTMMLEKSFITSENASKINWGPNQNAMYAIVNKDAKTELGEYPGYRVTPGLGGVYLTVENSTIGGNAVHMSRNNLFVTKQKDSEARASNPNNLFDIVTPLVNFDKYFDGDSLDQEDLVMFFNLGMHHIPHTGDLPITMYTTAASSIFISPLNYLTGDPSSATHQQVRINDATKESPETLVTFGAETANCSVDLNLLLGPIPQAQFLPGPLTRLA